MTILKTELQKLNEEFWIFKDSQNMNEMARIEKVIIVHNDREPGQDIDNLKFAHFHYNNIHFKFRQQCPKNITELKTMIAFNSEITKINNKALSTLLGILQRRPSGSLRGKYNNVYDYVLDVWETLNERNADFID